MVLELAGLLKSGMPANLARSELQSQLELLSPIQLSQLDSVWLQAIRSGASISGAMQALGEVFLLTAKNRREIELAFASPKATAKLVTWLPAVSLGLAQLFGLNPLSAVVKSPIALLSLIFGFVLLFIGRFWAQSIVKKATPSEIDPGLFFDSIRFGLAAGLPMPRAVEAAQEAMLKDLHQEPDGVSMSRLQRIVTINRSSGASISELLAAEALARREEKRFLEAEKLAKLSVRLMIPLGTLTLPAFVFSAIVPVAISLLSTRQL